jgi:hypothetical protein
MGWSAIEEEEEEVSVACWCIAIHTRAFWTGN